MAQCRETEWPGTISALMDGPLLGPLLGQLDFEKEETNSSLVASFGSSVASFVNSSVSR